jgi:ubiquinone biosynthesis protein
MLRTLRHIGRLFAIARTLARHDALFFIEQGNLAPALARVARLVAKKQPGKRPGQRLAAALEALGPSFIKLGQSLATRADLLGESVAADLSALHDRLPPFESKLARKTVEDELGGPLAQFFSSFDDQPVAAASIAQVHFAVTSDGREVAVKILRPNIEDAFQRDLDLLFWIGEQIERTRPDLRRFRPLAVAETLAEWVRVEMDLRLEGAAAAELAENFMGDDDIFRVPRVDWDRTGRRVLTTERVTGIRVDDREALIAAGHDPTEILANAAAVFFKQVFRDGFFHADQHPGNAFVAPDGAIVAVDFGIMGRLDRKTRFFLADMLLGFLTGDYRKVAEVHFRAGYVPESQSMEMFTQAIRAIAEPILDKPMNEISLAKLLGLMLQVTETFQMETQPQLLLLQKTMLVTEGVGRRLNPDVNMWALARPLIEAWMRDNRGPEARLRETAGDLAGMIERLPSLLVHLEKAARDLAKGGLRLEDETLSELRKGDKFGRALVYPLWIIAALLAVLVLFG